MVSPAHHRRNHVSWSEILRCAARRLLLQSQSKVVVGREGADDDSAKTNSVPADHLEKKITKIWRAVALVIDNSLLSTSRGVRIESFGTFAIDVKGRARFFLASEFAARHRLLKYDVCAGGCMAGGAVNTRLNVAKVAATAGSLRPDAERVVDAVLRSVRQCLSIGKSVTLSFHPVAEFCCAPGAEAAMRYLPGFRARRKAAVAAATCAQIGVGRAKSTPWATAATASVSAAAAADAAATAATTTPTATTCSRRERVIARPTVEEHVKGGPALVAKQRPDDGGFVETTIQRPHSASPAFPSNLKTHHVVTNLSGVTHGSGNIHSARERDISATTTVAVERRHAWDEPRGTRTWDDNEKYPSRIKSPSSQQASLGAPNSVRASQNVRGDHHSEIIYTGDNTPVVVDRSVDEETARQACETRPIINGRNIRGGGNINKRKERRENWLADLLQRRTLEQEGDEGLRRLVATFKVMYVGDNGRNKQSSTAGGRLSGKDLLQVLRDIGTKLSSDELVETARVFRLQPDARMCLRRLLFALEGGTGITISQRSVERIAGQTPSPIGVPTQSWPEVCRGTSRCRRPRSSDSRRDAARLELCRHGSPLHPGKGVVSGSSCGGSRAAHEQTMEVGSCWTGNTESTGDGSSKGTGVEGQRSDGDGGRQRPMGGSRHEESDASRILGAATAKPTRRTESVMSQQRRECWVDAVDGGKVTAQAAAAADGDAMADLARIIYDPPCSLEGLIDVLQASKVTEQPTIACATLSARLVQLSPRLGKGRAKALAAAACHYPDKQIDLGRLHCVLQRRFGRRSREGASSCSAERASRKNGVSTATTSSTTMFSASSEIVSCAAVQRVRRNLLAGRLGMRGLKHCLATAGRLGDGSLSKDELRRALVMAGGHGSHPPTTKDVDDLFTLFSCRTEAGVGGGRVDAATVLRGLRGELSTCREAVVREVFHGLLLRRGDAENTISSRGGRGEGEDRGARTGGRTGAARHALDATISLEQLRDACNDSGCNAGLLTNRSGSSSRGVARCGDGQIVVLREGDLGGFGADVERIRPLLAAGSGKQTGGKVGRRVAAAEKDVTIEQFLDYYTDLSAGIDGDDAFEATVRGSWSLHPPPKATCRADIVSTADEQGIGNCRRSAYYSQLPRPRLENDHPKICQINQGREVDASVVVAVTSGRARTAGEKEDSKVVGRRQPDQYRPPRDSGFTLFQQQQQQPQQKQQQQQRPRHQRKSIHAPVAEAATSTAGGKYQEECGGRARTPPPAEIPVRSPAINDDDDGSRRKSSSARALRRAGTSSASAEGAGGGHDPHNGEQRRGGTPMNNDNNNNNSNRSVAAVRVQRMFRGHRGRQSAAAEDRKRASQRAAEREAQEERERRGVYRRLATRLPRPKVSGTYGF